VGDKAGGIRTERTVYLPPALSPTQVTGSGD